MMRPEVEDVLRIVGYRYFPECDDTVLEYAASIKENEFFKYARCNKLNAVESKCIPLRGFTLKEIETDDGIRVFSTFVKSLYVYVSKDVTDHLRYVKFLAWDE
jgi:hypothetical protein